VTLVPLRTAVAAGFERATGRPPHGLWFAPGRVNLIGEHTDYNDGYVLPMALPHGTVVAAAPRPDRVLRLRSLSAGTTVEVALDGLAPGMVDGWAAYAAGVAWALEKAGHTLVGAEVVLDGDVPLGAGLSSSASLECAVGTCLADLSGLALDATSMALLAQRAENDFVGMPCGAMDQLASMHGAAGHVVFIDTRSLAVEPVPFDLTGWGLALLVIDTRAPHRLVDSEYAQRRATCAEAARLLGLPALRDISDLDDALSRLADAPARRVRHVVTENERVLATVSALRSGADPRTVGPLLTASHVSLRDDYEVSVPELDVAVDAALGAGAHGARMTGGGFGGCVIALVEQPRAPQVEQAVAEAFAGRGFTPPVAFLAQPSDGAHRVSGSDVS
jgi:galactokinase